jgi:hypothetical protein
MTDNGNQAREAAPEMLEALKFAVARVRVANAEGDPILSAWLPGADAAIAKAEGRADRSTAAPTEGLDGTLDGLRRAEQFISGFEDDPLQDGIDWMLDAIRAVIAAMEKGAAGTLSPIEYSGSDQL